jgi:uncharacterized protein (TIGR02246 family)
MNASRLSLSASIAACLLTLSSAVRPASGAEFSPVANPPAPLTLEQVRDRIMIQDLWSAYVFALDTMDAEGVANLFTEDAVFSIAQADASPAHVLKGRAAIVAELAAFRDRPRNKELTKDAHGRVFSPVRHVLTSLFVNLQGDTATAESYWMEIASSGRNSSGKGLSPHVLNMGRYEDVYVKQKGRWLIKQRAVLGDMWDLRVPTLQSP